MTIGRMNKTPLEAFSDGVIDIMVLGFKVPLLSSVNVGVHWNNHHREWVRAYPTPYQRKLKSNAVPTNTANPSQ